MATVKTDDKHYKNIAQAIRDKTGGNAQYKPGEMADGVGEVYDAGYAKGQAEGGGGSYDEGYEAGQQAEYDRFWDLYQQNGNRVDYAHGFGGLGWTNETFRPKYDIRPTLAYMLFRNSAIAGDLVEILENLGIVLDLSQCTITQYMLTNTKITRVGVMDLRNNTAGADGMFACQTLKTIDLIQLTEEQNDGDTMFNGTPSLEDVTFDGVIGNSIQFKACSKLTAVSVQSIIDHLKDLTGQAAKTLTFHATVGGNLTDEQKATIAAKNWQLVY